MRVRFLFLIAALTACTPAPPAVDSPRFSLEGASSSTLRVVSVSGDDLSSGSGVAVAPNIVLTNRHVIANALRDGLNFQVYVFDNNTSFPRRANAIVAQDPRLDLAILYVRGITSAPVQFALAPPGQLEQVTALGFPAATDEVFDRIQENASATSGQVTAVNRGPVGDFGPIDLVLHTATVNPGNSGGPLFNTCGELAGINTLRGNPSDTSNVFVASSVSEVTPFLRSFGVAVQVAAAVCEAADVVEDCSFDRASVEVAVENGDLRELDEAIGAIPRSCLSLRSEAWSRRDALVTSMSDAFLPITGTWRLPNERCDSAIWLIQSGSSVVGYNGADSQVERFTMIGGGNVSTSTIHPASDTTYRYSLVEGRLKIENLKSNQAWELERCTGL